MTTDRQNTIKPATNLDEVFDLFDPISDNYNNDNFYVPRSEKSLNRLSKMLKRGRRFHGFLCGHVGCGKTTELKRLIKEKDVTDKYYPVLFSIKDIQVDTNKLSHDALLISIGHTLISKCPAEVLDPKFADRLNKWGAQLIKATLNSVEVNKQIKGDIKLWLVHFRAYLRHRDIKKEQSKQVIEPKVIELIDLINEMSIEIELKTGKKLLVLVDDLEKGNDGDRQMHHRIFNEYYDVITKPNFNIIYTLPVYFRGLTDKRIRDEDIFSFSAARLYNPEKKSERQPKLDHQSEGYQLVKNFINKRIANPDELFAKDVLDQLILIGGGLFRETDLAISQAADFAMDRNSDTIEQQDVDVVFNEIKKNFQPSIRSKELQLLKQVQESKIGWINDIEPLLQSGAVVEYANGDIWLDIRYVLKAFVEQLSSIEGTVKSTIITDQNK